MIKHIICALVVLKPSLEAKHECDHVKFIKMHETAEYDGFPCIAVKMKTLRY